MVHCIASMNLEALREAVVAPMVANTLVIVGYLNGPIFRLRLYCLNQLHDVR
jgi:hypothetical protein